jgi:hypothetical protein
MATYECPKCGGSGYIAAYSGIANGVCFMCKGAGKLNYKPKAKKVQPLTPYLAGIIETIKTADFSTMEYGRLLALRDAAHWPTPHCPDLLKIWRERGESHFQEAQAERLSF